MSNDNEFVEELRKLNNEKLIDRFNRDVGSKGWVAARSRFHVAMKGQFISRGLDASAIMNKSTMSWTREVKLVGNALVPFGPIYGPENSRIFSVDNQNADHSSPSAKFKNNYMKEEPLGAKKTPQKESSSPEAQAQKHRDDQKQLSKFVQHLNSGGSVEDADERTRIWWINRY